MFGFPTLGSKPKYEKALTERRWANTQTLDEHRMLIAAVPSDLGLEQDLRIKWEIERNMKWKLGFRLRIIPGSCKGP